jgi:predicted transcriptional regulator
VTPVLAANLAELALVRDNLEGAIERVKDIPDLPTRIGVLLGICGVSSDRIRYALRAIEESSK